MDGNRQKTTNEFMLRLEMIVLGQVKGVDCLSSSMAFHARSQKSLGETGEVQTRNQF